MIFAYFLLPVLLNAWTSKAAIFMWSNKKLQISPLQPFTKEHLSNLTNELGNPEVFYFRSSSRISPHIKSVIDGYYSAYVPNGDMHIEESIDLPGVDLLDAEKIRETLSQSNRSENILSMIIVPHKQHKREIGKVTSEEPNGKKALRKKKETVMYINQNKNNQLYALLYSSKPLLFKTNDTEIYLGNTQSDMIIYDSRLNVHVIVQDGSKIALRFIFTRANGYWSMPLVKLQKVTNLNKEDYNLTTDEDILAPDHFSYHCNGYTLFYGGGAELYIYDLQVQIDSTNGKFGDANDCVSFTTAPIWSGLFVTTLLGIGLIVALTAIMDIKTMDKFDNYKTKNLNITISE